MNANEMKLGFQMRTKEIPLEAILPIRTIKSPHNVRRYQAILKSMREVGMIEPLVVHPQKTSQARSCCWMGICELSR